MEITTTVESSFSSFDNSEVWYQAELEKFISGMDNPLAVKEEQKDLAVSRVMRMTRNKDVDSFAYMIVELAFLYLKQMTALQLNGDDMDRQMYIEKIILSASPLLDTDGDGISDSSPSGFAVLKREKKF
jgi:hypothetical protein